TIREFVRDTWDRESLRELFLLTLADVLTTSAKAVTTWKLGMLNALFRSGEAFLAGEAGSSLSGRAARVRESVRSLWSAQEPKSLADISGFLESMPERYFLANSPEEVMAHAQLALRGGDESVSISWMPSTHDGVLGLCVVAEPHSGLGMGVIAGDGRVLLASLH